MGRGSQFFMEIFKLAAGRTLPAAITAEGEGNQRYVIGNVVYHLAKPTVVPWRKQNVQFAQSEDGDAVSLTGILLPAYTRQLSQLRHQATLFASTGKRETTQEFTTQRTGKAITIWAEFGALYQIASNLLAVLDSTSGTLEADLENPVTQKVLGNGGHFFVVSTLYEAEKAEIKIREEIEIGNEQPQWKNGVLQQKETTMHQMLGL